MKHEKLKKLAIKIDIHQEHLNPASRINLADPQTIQHNQALQFIGKVSDQHLTRLLGYYRDVQALKKKTNGTKDKEDDDTDEDDHEDDEEEEEEEDLISRLSIQEYSAIP